jgi:16S rRNA (uracil1498-N3)-methyltransferase
LQTNAVLLQQDRPPMTYFLHDAPLAAGQAVELRGEEARHLLTVRRVRVGERFALQDPQGHRFEAELTDAERRVARARIHGPLPVPAPPSVRVTLLQAAVKDKAAELLIEKCTELGVAALCFFPSARSTVPHKALGAPGTQGRWKRLAWEACKQCDRQFPPHVAVLPDLAETLRAHAVQRDAGVRGWVLEPGAECSAAQALNAGPTEALHVLIGPEGGLTAEEVAAAIAAGYTPVRLGSTMLRAETAALAACALGVLAQG